MSPAEPVATIALQAVSCSGCRWWARDDHSGEPEEHPCDRDGHPEALFTLWPTSTLYTAARFACIHWEARP